MHTKFYNLAISEKRAYTNGEAKYRKLHDNTYTFFVCVDVYVGVYAHAYKKPCQRIPNSLMKHI